MGESEKNPAVKVVVIEDEPSFLRFWERILGEMGLADIHYFSNSKKAAAFLKKNPVTLLISDVVMPSIDGYEIAKTARKISPACRVILTTAYSTDLSRFNLAGLRFHLLHKPYADISALKRFIIHLLNNDTSFDDISEDSSSDNEDYPLVTEWKL